ncbi:MAG TPA: ATP-binding protein [Vicinamibacterales bacterium]|jgi:PAS domain S-box-containing protein|nr:ATP-binding protein [Vicinamibacterales bacterium]
MSETPERVAAVEGSDLVDQLRRRERQFRESQQIARVGSWEWDLEADRIEWSDELFRLWSLDPAASFSYADYINRVHPDDRDYIQDVISRAVQFGGTYSVEHRILLPSGEQRWIHGRGEVIKNAAGQAVHLRGTAQDVTDRVLAEDRARALYREQLARGRAQNERERFYRLLNAAPALIAVVRGPDYVLDFVNDRFREAVGQGSIVGRPLRDAFPASRNDVIGLVDKVYATGERQTSTEVPSAATPDGQPSAVDTTYFDFVCEPLTSEGGEVDGVMIHAVDVTDHVAARAREREIRQALEESETRYRRRAEELTRLTASLERTNRELDAFAYAASHDLRAPLRGIANLAQWIEEDVSDKLTDDSRQMLQMMRGRMHRMEALIDGILQYSRAGRHHDAPGNIDLGALLRDVIDLLAPTHGTVAIVSDMPVVFAERVPLQQVFQNLIGNALKHGGEDVRVEISAHDAGNCWEFRVSDNGPGIPPEYHRRIWDIFQTLQPRDEVEGTGIGLALVKKFVETQGGHVNVDSSPGKGATFTVSWPKQTPPEAV